MIETAFSTLACPDWSWRQVLERGKQYGFDGVEVRLLEREPNLLARAEFRRPELPARRRELSDTGFRVCGLASSVRFDEPDAKQRAKQVETGRAYIDLAVELDASFVRVFGDVLPENESQRDRTIGNIAEGLHRLGEYAEPSGVSVVIETHGDYSDSSVVQRTLQSVESPAVGVLWDTHHPWRFCSEELHATFERIGPWVRHTHWKDSVAFSSRKASDENARQAAREAHALMSGHRHADYVLFGGGEFPVIDCLQLLANSGYQGWLSLEWEKAWHPELEDPEIALPLFPGKIRELCDLVTGGS